MDPDPKEIVSTLKGSSENQLPDRTTLIPASGTGLKGQQRFSYNLVRAGVTGIGSPWKAIMQSPESSFPCADLMFALKVGAEPATV